MIEPDYYNEGTEDIIDAYWNTHSVERARGFMEGNVWKYTARFPSKNVGIEDLKKAQTYIQKWIDKECLLVNGGILDEKADTNRS